MNVDERVCKELPLEADTVVVDWSLKNVPTVDPWNEVDKVVVERSLEDVPIVDDECEIKVVLSMVDSTFVDLRILSVVVVNAVEVINKEEWDCRELPLEVVIVVVDRSLENVPIVDDECEIIIYLSIVDSTFVDWWIFSVVVGNAVEVINKEEWVCTVVDEWKFFVDPWSSEVMNVNEGVCNELP